MGVNQVTISESGGQYMLTGMGQPVALQRSGDVYVATGVTVLGKSGQTVQLRPTPGGQVELVARDAQGQSSTMVLTAEAPQQ